MVKMIDSHIHLDLYQEEQLEQLLSSLDSIEALITVSFHLHSCKKNLLIASKTNKIKVAFGYHPEQSLPDEASTEELFQWIRQNQHRMIAIGEVGLPYYLRKEHPELKLEGYVELLERFVLLAKELDKPIILHAVYKDASIVCDLLEKHSVSKAHFHWFKGDSSTIRRMADNGYFISVTPDVCYEKEIQELVEMYPIDQLMVETDGPWPFEGPFHGKMTHPVMIQSSIRQISELLNMSEQQIVTIVRDNVRRFFCL
ncbi:TatD family hydrolase [Bacillus sp. 31A1R]|uniref:TatD family hydrolase n=1 Tax=Robertmurraya mangrovi TaxID=3098077 RepID=A0ABU5ITL2_9BACI|nr:TatD family hydrolase [Bacillus sp. 31A1R]MDZ5470492.1 TatD family hydrolase [Bacillus sp. 31A1R]